MDPNERERWNRAANAALRLWECDVPVDPERFIEENRLTPAQKESLREELAKAQTILDAPAIRPDAMGAMMDALPEVHAVLLGGGEQCLTQCCPNRPDPGYAWCRSCKSRLRQFPLPKVDPAEDLLTREDRVEMGLCIEGCGKPAIGGGDLWCRRHRELLREARQAEEDAYWERVSAEESAEAFRAVVLQDLIADCGA